MKNIFLIETKHESSLFKTEEGVLLYNHSIEKRNCKSQFIYITNREDIEENDWTFDSGCIIVYKITNTKRENLNEEGCFKIVATNNPALIKDGVKAVNNLFLSFYAENQPDYVEVIKGFADGTSYGYNFLDYKLNFPQEKTKTEEKLYSKEDLEIAFNQGCAYTIGSHELFKQTHLNFEKWFNKFHI